MAGAAGNVLLSDINFEDFLSAEPAFWRAIQQRILHTEHRAPTPPGSVKLINAVGHHLTTWQLPNALRAELRNQYQSYVSQVAREQGMTDNRSLPLNRASWKFAELVRGLGCSLHGVLYMMVPAVGVCTWTLTLKTKQTNHKP